jgi:enterochelin esterase-like enzyme
MPARLGIRLVTAMYGLRRALLYLGWRQHLPGAGPRYASADDQWRMLRGRLPRYGVRPYHDAAGDLVLPLAASAPDEERRALGLPGAAEQRRQVEDENRRRASARWARRGLPPGVELARVWRPVTAAELERRWAAEGRPVWRDGEDLLLVHRAEAEAVDVFPAIQLPMWRVEGDLWALMVRISQLDQAALSLAFVGARAGSGLGQVVPDPVVWRGPTAPASPPRAEPLAGELHQVELDSPALAQRRALSVYLPPPAGERRPPAVYLADGGSVPGFAAVLEPAILAGSTPAVVLVGVHCAPSTAEDDARGREYLPGRDPRRFEAHRRFFLDEVPAWAEREFGVPAGRLGRAVAGFSNGAVLASALGCSQPDRVGSVIAFSPGVAPPLPAGARPARHYLLAGTLEAGFRRSTHEWARRLSGRGVEVEHRERVCGHDPLMWQEELPAAIRWAFGEPAG